MGMEKHQWESKSGIRIQNKDRNITCFSYRFSLTSDMRGLTTSPTYSITISSTPMCSMANSPQSWIADFPDRIVQILFINREKIWKFSPVWTLFSSVSDNPGPVFSILHIKCKMSCIKKACYSYCFHRCKVIYFASWAFPILRFFPVCNFPPFIYLHFNFFSLNLHFLFFSSAGTPSILLYTRGVLSF